MAKQPKKAQPNGDARLRLKDITVPMSFVLLDFGDVFSHEEYGDSVPLELENTVSGKVITMWLNGKTKAGRTFFERMNAAAVETPCRVSFRPRKFTGDDGKERTSVSMTIGPRISHGAAASESVPF